MSSTKGRTNHKIRDLEELAQLLGSARAEGKRVVHCHGVFDLLHIGHIRHFQQAKAMGDILVVTATPDRYVNKGPGRPAFHETLRAEALAALDCVDYVAINKWPQAVKTIELLRPDYYVKGSDYKDAQDDRTGGIALETAAVRSAGGELVLTDDVTFSSSHLINRHLPVFPPEVAEHLTSLSQRYTAGQVIRYLEGARSLKVLVFGETIIDEYQHCNVIGKSSKEPILAARYLSTEKFAGGVLAVANNVANFCDQVTLVTSLGANNPQEDFVRKNLNPNVKANFLYKENSPTIVKRRFLESHLMQKLFEVYEINDDELDEVQGAELVARLEEQAPQHDVVLVVDYGHGLINSSAVGALCRTAPFLVVNTQSNAGNRGFNTISKYPRADYVCLSADEIALEERNRRGDLRKMILSVSRKLDCSRVMVTRSKEGNTCYGREEGFCESPALAHHVVDRVGAGDAVLALTSLCVAQGAPIDIVGFIGNTAGAAAVATVGHRDSIHPLPLFRHIEALLK